VTDRNQNIHVPFPFPHQGTHFFSCIPWCSLLPYKHLLYNTMKKLVYTLVWLPLHAHGPEILDRITAPEKAEHFPSSEPPLLASKLQPKCVPIPDCSQIPEPSPSGAGGPRLKGRRHKSSFCIKTGFECLTIPHSSSRISESSPCEALQGVVAGPRLEGGGAGAASA